MVECHDLESTNVKVEEIYVVKTDSLEQASLIEGLLSIVLSWPSVRQIMYR